MRKHIALLLALMLSATIVSACGSTAVKEIIVEEIPPKVETKTETAEVVKEPKVEVVQPEVKEEPPKTQLKFDWFSTVTGANKNGDVYTLTWSDDKGNTKKLTDLGGKVYLIDVWAQWCPPCKASTPSLVELHNKYANMGLVIIGINIDEQGSIMQAMEYGIGEGLMGKYPIIYDNQGALTGGIFVQNGIPNFTLLDKNGKLITEHTGGLIKGDEGFNNLEKLILNNLK
jgi:thiol-disulfide isomerase/thioredoxin